MTDHKFTDDDVIKALECCRDFGDCSLCPYEGAAFDDDPDCAEKLHTDALALINRQKAEIERLKKHNTEVAFKHYNDGIKEFAWRLKNILTPYPEAPFCEMVGSLDIDALVEEMTEGTK